MTTRKHSPAMHAALLTAVLTTFALSACQRQETASAPTETAGRGMAMETAPRADAQEHTATGKINAIDSSAATINISHGPVQSANWPAMTMNFQVQNPQALAGLQVGQQVEFSFTESDGGQYMITRVTPVGP